uniref:Uncharacterized protein n=1 Tax=Caenorhabditis japonica TaxID=281687 RepID=A0A8R1EER5_CAEJA
MIQQIFELSLTEPRIEGKVRQLVALVAGVPLQDVGIYFSWRKVLDKNRQDYFDLMIAEVLTSYFNVPTKPGDIQNMDAYWQILNRITCKGC